MTRHYEFLKKNIEFIYKFEKKFILPNDVTQKYYILIKFNYYKIIKIARLIFFMQQSRLHGKRKIYFIYKNDPI
jgi:hypothetical protein